MGSTIRTRAAMDLIVLAVLGLLLVGVVLVREIPEMPAGDPTVSAPRSTPATLPGRTSLIAGGPAGSPGR